jgi:small-conductance mechanosensitive channel
MKKVDLSTEQRMSLRRAQVNSDPMVSELSKTIVAMERDLITREAAVRDHPTLVQEQAALDNLKKRLDAKRQELEKEFDDGLQAREEEAAGHCRE